MGQKISTIIITLSFAFNIMIYGQSSDQYTYNSESVIFANPEILNNRVTIMDNHGNVSHGFLIGLKADTLLLSIGQERFMHSLKDLFHVSIDIEKNISKGLVLGGVLGIYLGSLAFLQAENQPAAYFNDTETLPVALLGLMSATVGGGIGYLIEKSSSNEQEIFIFSNDPFKWCDDYEELKKFLLGEKKEKTVHLKVQLSQVKTRFSELNEARDYFYSEATSFNLLRNITLTYAVYNNINLGLSVCWLSEPSLYYSNYTYNNSIWIQQEFDGMGYYLIGTYQPMDNLLDQSLVWEVGIGIGVGSVDFKSVIFKDTYGEYESNSDTRQTKIKKTLFSSIIYSNLDFYLYEGFSMGFAVDYVYLPKSVPGIPELKLKSRNFGNYSLGFNFGLHF